MAELVQRSRRPWARLGEDPAGRPATVIPFGPAAVLPSIGVLVAALVFAVLGVLAAVDAGSSGGAAGCGLVAAVAAAVVHRRHSLFGWNGDVRAPGGVLGIETRHLAVDEQTLLFLLASYQQHPELRSQLGTAESLQWRMLDARS